MNSPTRLAFGSILVLSFIVLAGGCPMQMPPPAGPQGDPGPAGADGQLRIYGDGSAGAKTVSSNEDWSTDGAAPTNIQFSDFTINNGVTLTVPSGTVIRCNGNFTNNGTITVLQGATGARRSNTDTTTIDGFYSSAHPGVTSRAAGDGEVGDNSMNFRLGGVASIGLTLLQARTLVMPGLWGGGGGGSALSLGGNGGGSFVVICMGAIANNGTIDANGTGGGMFLTGGGGGGGIVVLASMTSVTNSGTVNANGGAGGNGSTTSSAGGGGGGGIIHFLSPSNLPGTRNVAGGVKGTLGANLTANPRSAGGGGGACGGNGGNGGEVAADGVTPSEAQDGETGRALITTVDPTALF